MKRKQTGNTLKVINGAERGLIGENAFSLTR
jgi:hypothetical protein